MAQVRLISGLVIHNPNGRNTVHEPGDVIDVTEAAARRMIERKIAETVGAADPPKAKPAAPPPPTATKRRGKK